MKRLYVRPGVRGRRIGRAMCEELVSRATRNGVCPDEAGYVGGHARGAGLYRGLGFVPCERYNDDPMPDTLYFEMVLAAAK